MTGVQTCALPISVVLIGKPYSYKNTSDSISCIFNLADFFKTLGDTSFLSIDTDALKVMFKEYCKEKELSDGLVRIIIPCQHAILEFRDKREGFDRDFWDKSIIKIASNRVNQSLSFSPINFRLIKDKEDREYAKLYMRHLIGHTEMSYTTIYTYYGIIYAFCNFAQNTSVTDYSKSQVMDFVRKRAKNDWI